MLMYSRTPEFAKQTWTERAAKLNVNQSSMKRIVDGQYYKKIYRDFQNYIQHTEGQVPTLNKRHFSKLNEEKVTSIITSYYSKRVSARPTIDSLAAEIGVTNYVLKGILAGTLYKKIHHKVVTSLQIKKEDIITPASRQERQKQNHSTRALKTGRKKSNEMAT